MVAVFELEALHVVLLRTKQAPYGGHNPKKRTMKKITKPLFYRQLDPEKYPNGGKFAIWGYVIMFGNHSKTGVRIARLGNKVFTDLSECVKVARDIVKKRRYDVAQVAQLRTAGNDTVPWHHFTHGYTIKNGRLTITRYIGDRNVSRSL